VGLAGSAREFGCGGCEFCVVRVVGEMPVYVCSVLMVARFRISFSHAMNANF
jgi:hypothetical protein